MRVTFLTDQEFAEMSKQFAPAADDVITGDIVTVDDAAARPAVEVCSTIAPVQGGDPLTAVTLYHTGRNLFDVNNYTKIDHYINGAVLGNTPERSIRVPIIPGMTYTVHKAVATSIRVGTCVDTPAGGMSLTSVVQHRTPSASPLTITAGPDDCWMVVQLLINDDFNRGITIESCVPSLMIEYGETASPYEEYKGHTLTANLPTPCYGGQLDWLSGELTITHDADGVLTENVTHQLTPHRINMLRGGNALWSDSGDTSVTYVVDIKSYIDKKFTELQNAILASGANI